MSSGTGLRVPWVPSVRGIPVEMNQRVLDWLRQKSRLRQDMFLLGDPGAHLRQVVLQFAALEGYEVEYVGITRDTNEADLKQRREINDGHLKFHNSPAVEAALRGRLLILEGIEKAERNVLPLLNNLLENREMSLEDGSFLMAPGRIPADGEVSTGGRRLLPVSKDFLVVAIGLPVPKYPGSQLDPPLRSRFAGRTIHSLSPTDELALLQEVAPSAPKDILQKLVGCIGSWRASGDPHAALGVVKSSSQKEVEALTKGPRLPRFPELGMLSVARLIELFPNLPAAAALHSAFPFSAFNLTEHESKTLNAALNAYQLEIPTDRRGYSIDDVKEHGDRQATIKLELTGQGTVQAICPKGSWPIDVNPIWQLTLAQRPLLLRMLQDHCIGMDICIIGERGVGKTILARTFAQVLGYRMYTIFCFRDMTSRDLTQRRGTDDRGNTTWHLSPLLEAALTGGLAVLDGIHRLATGALAGSLGRLLCDRAFQLPSGEQLVPWAQWSHWLEKGKTEEELRASGFRPVHPAFRIVATAEPPESGKARTWLDDEVLTLFHFTDVRPMQSKDQLKLVQSLCDLEDAKLVKGLIGYMQALRKAAQADPTLEPMLLSTRQLLHAGRHLEKRPGDVNEAIIGALSAYFRFLPVLTRDSVSRLIKQAMQEVGIKVDLRSDEAVKEANRKAAIAKQRGERLRSLEDPAIGLRFSPNPRAEQGISQETLKLEQEAEQERKRAQDNVMKEASAVLKQDGKTAQEPILQVRDMGNEISIGDISATKRVPKQLELVPQTHFVDIPQHVTALRAMLIDWTLGRHLLLIGNQGVGKNKLADRFLGMLQIEREYLQLHRDTTVQSLTVQPVLRGGVVVYEDSPLVCAVRHGRVLVIDEADKAPLEVVCILKSLAEDGEFTLGDGRTVIQPSRMPPQLKCQEDPSLLPIADGFRMIVLANRPGFPFLGNDFYRECGDVFASHAVENPDVASEVELLRSYGPSVPDDIIVKLLGLFSELRRLFDAGMLAYPYSTRELVHIIQHLDTFPDDDLEDVFSNVFSFDWHDRKLRETLADILHGFGVGMGSGRAEPIRMGDVNKKLPEGFKTARHWDSGNNAPDDRRMPGDVGTRDWDDKEDHSGMRHKPRRELADNWDGREHLGEGPWAGGSGGTGGAGLGGRAGPMRQDVGQTMVILSEEAQRDVPDEWHDIAKQLANEAYAERLQQLGMSAFDEQEYAAFRAAVAPQIDAMRIILQSHEAKERERMWLKQQTHGELDDTRIVDGIVGARNIYTRRGEADSLGQEQSLPKRIKFVLDVSGSMYTFNRIDRRLQRLQEVAIFIIESFAGLEHKYEYSIVGHSGTAPEAEMLVPWGKPPASAKEQLALVRRMAAHAQYCHKGDHTLEATDIAIKDVVKVPADEYFVFIVSDADLARYGITPESWNQILMQNQHVSAYALLISANTNEAEQIRAGLAPGHGFVCDDNDLLAVTFKQIFQATVLKHGS
eukprot:TRINITY_DN88669_c0_g1_i1.p1 TRINITY_DN88669_c0_g1~~TRINITY_DN88669_c0_g1_i1.p1  ORF type:complete len:1490 (+),score=245.98 TRINITY_DN88669_c0_g1_i1:43-4470(+)